MTITNAIDVACEECGCGRFYVDNVVMERDYQGRHDGDMHIYRCSQCGTKYQLFTIKEDAE